MKNKRMVLLAALVIAVVLGSIAAGVTFAQTESGDDSQAKTQYEAFLDKVSQIYQQNTGVALGPEQLKEAFAQAQKEMQDEALQSRLDNLVSEGKITQEQADEYLQWWQSRPDDIPLVGSRGGGGAEAMVVRVALITSPETSDTCGQCPDDCRWPID